MHFFRLRTHDIGRNAKGANDHARDYLTRLNACRKEHIGLRNCSIITYTIAVEGVPTDIRQAFIGIDSVLKSRAIPEVRGYTRDCCDRI